MQLIKEYSYTEGTRNVIYPIYEGHAIDEKLTALLGYDVKDDIKTELGAVTPVLTLGRLPFSRVLFLGLGKAEEITSAKLRKALASLAKQVQETVDFALDYAVCENLPAARIAQVYAECCQMNLYVEQVQGHEWKEIPEQYVISAADIEEELTLGEIIGKAVNYQKHLADTPANLMTPSILVKEAVSLADRLGLECTVLDKAKLEEMKAGGILAVNQGSDEPASMICLKYAGAAEDVPFKAVIGKGLTFDTGGYTIKSNSYGMKYDMIGGANVLAIMEILVKTGAKTNVYGIIPTTENMINGKAYRPQDVITTLSGKTVEIISTDAEGRMILCDALTYAQTLGVTHMIDMATLTGACMRALGFVYTGVFSNDDTFCQELMEAASRADEKVWRLPVDLEYLEMIKSTSADLKNSAGKPQGGASVAASFLQEFVQDGVKWIHLDVAGTGEVGGQATGVMIRTVAELLK